MKNEHGRHGLADQRYYSFVLVRGTADFNLSTYWRWVGNIHEPGISAEFLSDGVVIQHRKFKSGKSFARGAVAEALSERGEGRPPYYYDLFASKFKVNEEAYLLLGFPFVGLGQEIVQKLMDRHELFDSGEILGVNVPKLIAAMEEGLELENQYEALSTQVVGVQFIVHADKSLTAVRLGGDDPLSAQIYRDFLKDRVRRGHFLPDKCVLACERAWSDRRKGAEGLTRAFRSRVHVDEYGHFRFYVHLGCSNVRLIPYAVGQLRTLRCLQVVHGNPLLRTPRDEDTE